MNQTHYCGNCGAAVTPANAFCGSCGANQRLYAVPPQAAVPARPVPSKPWTPAQKIALACIVGFGVIGITAASIFEQYAKQAAKRTGSRGLGTAHVNPPSTPLPNLTPTEHLSKAKELAKPGALSYPTARQHLVAITPAAKEYKEAQKLWAEINRLEEAEKKKDEARAEKELIEARARYADEAERLFLDQGMDMHVNVSDRGNTTISFKYVLMSRPVVYKVQKDASLMQRLREMGFKKLIMTDGYYETWTFDL